jgi:hypothetical protein
MLGVARGRGVRRPELRGLWRSGFIFLVAAVCGLGARGGGRFWGLWWAWEWDQPRRGDETLRVVRPWVRCGLGRSVRRMGLGWRFRLARRRGRFPRDRVLRLQRRRLADSGGARGLAELGRRPRRQHLGPARFAIQKSTAPGRTTDIVSTSVAARNCATVGQRPPVAALPYRFRHRLRRSRWSS